MPDQLESMAYRMRDRSDVPWHNLGNPIEHDATVDEMLVAAGLDWTVSKRPMFTPVEIPGPGELWNIDNLSRVDDYFALVRDSDNKVLGPAGKDYIPTQNKQAFAFFKKFAEAGHMILETAGSLAGGKQVWVLAKITKTFRLEGGDEIAGFLLLSSPHIWGRSLVIKFVTIRVVCMNTFVMAMNESTVGKSFRMPHIRAFDLEAAKDAEASLGIANDLFDGFTETATKLASAKVTFDTIVRYVADLYQPELVTEAFGKSFYTMSPMKQAETLISGAAPQLDVMNFKRTALDVITAINTQPGADLASSVGTMWGAFNAVTYHSDHLAGRDRDNALQSAWFGPRSVLKAKALQRASQIATLVG